MKAAVRREVNKPLTIEEVQIDTPLSREVLIRTVATGVCHSDVHLVQGSYPARMPMVLGHEAAGIVEQVQQLTNGGVESSFEAIGLKQTAEQAWQMLRNGGTATVMGMIPVGTMVELHGVDFLFQKKIQGSSMGSNRFRVDMPRYVDFYLNGKLNLDAMVSQRIPLEQVNEAIDAMLRGEVARSVITFS
jgi:S-(hydroxymethyl)glutathione dehydrogenase/alcohol dehydrogenase